MSVLSLKIAILTQTHTYYEWNQNHNSTSLKWVNSNS